MPRMIKTPRTQELKSVVLKYCHGVKTKNVNLIGTFTIKNLRVYSYHVEIEVEFQGKVFLRYPRVGQWFDSSLWSQKNISKIKLNRILRKYLFDDITFQLNMFGLNFKYWDCIKKIKWK